MLESTSTCLILLGASEFPRSAHFQKSTAFLAAKERTKSYFTTTLGLKEPDQILDLFDTDLDPNSIHYQLESFIETRNPTLTDLVFFYTGHGGYDIANGGFLLAIRQSRDKNLGVSSITAKSLGKTFSTLAYDKRIYLILDCCFAADSYSAFFQGPVIDTITRQFGDSFPTKGLALLCSTSRNDPAMIVADRDITMFSEGLNHALQLGSASINKEWLSLREIGHLTWSFIKNLNRDTAVRPEVHTPIMPGGDIADSPLFRNAAWRAKGLAAAYNIEARKRDLECSIMNNNVAHVLKLFEGFLNDFDKNGRCTPTKVLIVSDFNALEHGKPQKEDWEAYDRYKQDRTTIYKRIMAVMTEVYPIAEAPSVKAFYLSQQPAKRVIARCHNIGKKVSADFSLQNISIVLGLGEITAILAENGNGKTSLLRILAGDLRHDSGTLEYPQFGTSKKTNNAGKAKGGIKAKDWPAIKHAIGYVEQHLHPWRSNRTVRQQLQYNAAIKGITGKDNDRQFDFIIARLGLEAYRHYKWNELSGGYRLRFELARQLIWKPRLLILDEPLANLDVKGQQLFLNDLRSLTDSISHSMAVVISSQNLYEIERIADQLLFLRDGAAAYKGNAAEIGDTHTFRCYETDTNHDNQTIRQALAGLDIKEIRYDTFYRLIFTSTAVSPGPILSALTAHGIEVRYFREITHSTRILFEND